MKVSIFDQFGAMNSPPIFNAFKAGAIQCGDKVVKHDMNADVAVIWSILFAGRMKQNEEVWNHYRNQGKSVVVIEVGQLMRNVTWRVGLNGINREADFANDVEYDSETSRYNNVFKKHIPLKPWKDEGEFIVIATQRQDSHQWVNMPTTEQWVFQTIEKIRKYSEKPIVIRPHPRDKITDYHFISERYPHVYFSMPQFIDQGDKVDFPSLLERTHLVVNHSSGPAIESVIHGVPVISSESSLTWEVSEKKYENIENPYKPDRKNWIERLSYTEWHETEIAAGYPWQRLRRHV